MDFPIPKSLKNLWESWELRSLLILSLSLQAILILVSPLRKRTKNDLIFFLLWSAYLMADWVAGFAVGIISSNQGKKNDCSNKKTIYDPDILAFWAPFLLVHLGGPDTISAFALEDNELWLRHLAALIFQSVAAVYVFYQTLPKNRLWIPTTFMFIAGLIKYAERTMSLYRASLKIFRESMLKEPDPGPNYAKLMDEYRSMKDANLPTSIEMIPEPERGTKSVDRVKKGKLTETEVILYAKHFFDTFKGLIVDLIFSSRERNQSRDFFLQRNDEDAFKLIQAELNFIYESLYSKVTVVYSRLGYLFRFISFALVVTSLGLFYYVDKINFDRDDTVITYTLLIGAIVLDLLAFIKLITSDWFIVSINKLPDVDLKNPEEYQDGSGKSSKSPAYGYFGKLLQVLLRRWSETVPCYNLLFYCLNPRSALKEKIIDLLFLTNFLDGLKYVKPEPFTKDLRKHIYDELKMKSNMADDLSTAKEISAAKGDWTLRAESCTQFLPYVLEVDYDQSLLLWHIATELCYIHDTNTNGSKLTSDEEKLHKDFSKLLSDYMLYLLIMQPQMMSKVAGIGEIRFRDTCAEAKIFLGSEFGGRKKKELKHSGGILSYVCFAIVIVIACFIVPFILPTIYIISLVTNGCCLKQAHEKMRKQAKKYFSNMRDYFLKKVVLEEKQREACRMMFDVNTVVKPVAIKGDRSKSVLFDGCILAKELRDLENNTEIKSKWFVISKVWVEMMSYAAINCSAQTHAQQLSKGGELITMVWFLMVHFGLGDQFQINEGRARAKLIVGK